MQVAAEAKLSRFVNANDANNPIFLCIAYNHSKGWETGLQPQLRGREVNSKHAVVLSFAWSRNTQHPCMMCVQVAAHQDSMVTHLNAIPKLPAACACPR